MTNIYQSGQLNTTALVVPGTYAQIVPPTNQVVNGVPTSLLALVGTASWGPVNGPAVFGTVAQGVSIFGQLNARKYDLMTAVNVAALQGASNFVAVRVTDGTDVAATATISISSTAAITFTSKYTGTAGNGISVQLTQGSAASSWAAIVSIAGVGLAPEKFDNITGNGATLWANIASAINNGQSGFRTPSGIIVATAGTSSSAPTAGTTTLTGGLDGATPGTSHVLSTTLVGSDSAVPRTGMYALRGQGASVGCLVDADDSTQWTYQAAFGASEGVYMIGTTPSGDTISNAATTKATAGIDTYPFKLMFGDWIQISDQINNIYRYVAPSVFVAGLLSNTAPQGSSLNQPLNGIIGTQKDATGLNYTQADLAQIILAGLDVIANPSPGGTYYSVQSGNNTSSNASIQGDNYTRMTNYIATTVNTVGGQFVGKANNAQTQAQLKAVLDNFFDAMLDQGQIVGFTTICNSTNNPQIRVAAGYLQADILVTYLSIVRKVILNVQGGQTVVTMSPITQAA